MTKPSKLPKKKKKDAQKASCSKDLPANNESKNDPKEVNTSKMEPPTKKATGTQKLTTSAKQASNIHQGTRYNLEKKPLKSNLQFSLSLTMLLNKGLTLSEYPDPTDYIHKYLLKHKSILQQLVELVCESRDFDVCKNALKVLYELLVDSELLYQSEKIDPNECLSYMENYSLLIESFYTLHERFSGHVEYKTNIIQMRARLLELTVALGVFKACKDQLKLVTTCGVEFVGKLLTNDFPREQTDSVLILIKLLCCKRVNCGVFANSHFYNTLCQYYYHETTRNHVLSILAIMAKTKTSLLQMAEHKEIIDLMLTELVSTDQESPVSKFEILTMLYESTRNDYALYIISKKENFDRLYAQFTLNIASEENSFQLMLYTILNLCVRNNIMYDPTPNVDLFMTDKPKRIDTAPAVSDDSLSDSDDSSENSLRTEDEQHSHRLTEPAVSIEQLPLTSEVIDTAPLTDMNQFFSEIKKTNIEHLKFDLFAKASSLINPVTFIENKVGRIPIKNKLAYPDFVMLNAIPDTDSINLAYNMFPQQHYDYKLQCACGMIKNTFAAQVVYDINHLRDYSPLYNLGFDSCFECSNLYRATQVDHYEYDVVISPDTNERAAIQWFYFQVTNVRSDVFYRFNIINFTHGKNMYNKGMRPLMFSTIDYQLNGTGWVRCGENITHCGNRYTDMSCSKQYRSLSFSIKFSHSADSIYFASHYPYTYTRLMALLAPLLNHQSDKIYVRLDKLCNSAHELNEVPLITITEKRNAKCVIPLAARPIVIITARVHPGESNSSWIMEGLFKLLLNEGNQHATHAREHFIFKIVPMLNPEGVVAGNTRVSLTGYDLNRRWNNPDRITCPEIYYTKRIVQYVLEELRRPVGTYIDIHGHSKRKGFFFYGCNPKLSWNKDDRLRADRCEVVKFLPQTVATTSKHLCVPNCSYQIAKNKEKAARVVLWREFKIENSYTLECSFSEAYQRKCIDTKVLYDMGESVIVALSEIATNAYRLKKCIPAFGLNFKNTVKPTDKKETTKKVPTVKRNF